MGWFSARWLCSDEDCQEIWDETVDSNLKDDPLKCPVCEGLTGKRIPFANITKASYVDGNNRFADIKEMRKLDVLTRKANRKGDRVEAARIQEEKKKHFGGKRASDK